MPSERVLICGAGISGSVLAFWLAKNEFQVVVVERSKVEQKLGQGIEIEEPALKVVKLMGILDELKERKTEEKGFILNDKDHHAWAKFEVGRLVSPTGNLELMRGDQAEILYKAADSFPNVTYHFETTIKSLRQTQDKVIVDLENRGNRTSRVEEFDFVVGADGQKSRTRDLAMGSPEELDCFKQIGAYVAYFSIPTEDQDLPYSRLCQFPGRRILWTRPTGKGSGVTSCHFIHINGNAPAIRQANAAGDRMKQKEAFAEVYSGLDWETPRVVKQMMETENFYSEELAQVKLQKWSQGRVVLLGDAAWAPTPFTGQGNQLAIIGAWVLAQEMSRNRDLVAFELYEKRLRSYVESSQNIPLGGYMPYICAPQTTWGIWLFRVVLSLVALAVRFISWTNWTRFIPEGKEQDEFDLEMDEAQAKMLR
ncbi:MAG: hypothetical protein MMC23_008804 [Stictis urceolatum]|nr:hypothetical protein [Stictis urceolata]